MRLWVVLLAVLLSGCLSTLPHSPPADPCRGISHQASGTHAGAWDNATRAGSGFGTPSMGPGVPVGPGVARLLGSEANITGVRWRVDGGPVEDAGNSWSNGRLTSPEYLEVRFRGEAVLDGALDPTRTREEAEAVVRNFLDQVRGVREDNAELAADLAPTLQAPTGGDGDGTARSGGETAPTAPERPAPLPDGPWALSSHLATHVDASTLRDDALLLAVVHGPWRWHLDVPRASNTTHLEGASWYVVVDARDGVHVGHGSTQKLNETALLARLAAFLPQHGVVGADLSAWSLRLDGGPSDLCAPNLP